MKVIKCELCGSNDIVKDNGVFVCQYCGTKYSLEEAKKMMVEGVVEVSGTVKVDNTSKYDNLKKLAERSFKDELYHEAFEYYDKMLELNPDDWEAVYKKGICAAWQSTLANFRVDETVKASKNAFNIINVLNIENVNLKKIKVDMATDINAVVVAFCNLAMEHYNQYWELENSASEYWERLMQCINADEYALTLLEDDIISSDEFAKDLYITILKNLVIYYCEICMTRRYKSGYNQYGATYANVWYRNELRQPLIDKYNDAVAKIKIYEPEYIPQQIQTVGKGGCYVATSVYGSYDCPEVWTLRRYRDYILDKTWYGRAFIKTYYTVSPTIVKIFGNQKWFKKLFKAKLDKMVEKLQKEGIKSTAYNDKY